MVVFMHEIYLIKASTSMKRRDVLLIHLFVVVVKLLSNMRMCMCCLLGLCT